MLNPKERAVLSILSRSDFAGKMQQSGYIPEEKVQGVNRVFAEHSFF